MIYKEGVMFFLSNPAYSSEIIRRIEPPHD